MPSMPKFNLDGTVIPETLAGGDEKTRILEQFEDTGIIANSGPATDSDHEAYSSTQGSDLDDRSYSIGSRQHRAARPESNSDERWKSRSLVAVPLGALLILGAFYTIDKVEKTGGTAPSAIPGAESNKTTPTNVGISKNDQPKTSTTVKSPSTRVRSSGTRTDRTSTTSQNSPTTSRSTTTPAGSGRITKPVPKVTSTKKTNLIVSGSQNTLTTGVEAVIGTTSYKSNLSSEYLIGSTERKELPAVITYVQKQPEKIDLELPTSAQVITTIGNSVSSYLPRETNATLDPKFASSSGDSISKLGSSANYTDLSIMYNIGHFAGQLYANQALGRNPSFYGSNLAQIPADQRQAARASVQRVYPHTRISVQQGPTRIAGMESIRSEEETVNKNLKVTGVSITDFYFSRAEGTNLKLVFNTRGAEIKNRPVDIIFENTPVSWRQIIAANKADRLKS